jgi:hypothetical protein
VRHKVSTKVTSTNSSARSLLRGVGRVAIWTVLGLLLIRGALAEPSASPAPAKPTTVGVDPKSAAFAVRFARVYLADPTPAALDPFLAEGVRVAPGRAPQVEGADVAQAEVSESTELGDSRSVLTVACELSDSRTLFVAVPIARTDAGEVAALGAPSIVTETGRVGVASVERPQTLAGSAAPLIQVLVSKFLPEYLTATDTEALSYLLAPTTAVQPLAGAVELAGITDVSQLGSGEGPHRTVLVAARVDDASSGAIYPVVYRLDIVELAGRWYVSEIEGASS